MKDTKENAKPSENEMLPGNNGKSQDAEAAATEAPETGETKEKEGQEDLDSEDISDLITMLNAIQRVEGGAGDIADVPKPLRGVSRFLISKMMGLRDAFADPLFKAILDDMVDQKEEGKTPSVIVAISRVVPLDKIQEVADNENYSDIQGGVANAEKERQDAEAKSAALEMNINQFVQDIEAYCQEMSYDEIEKEGLTSFINKFINALADFKLTKEEIKEFDKARNYDRDISELKNSIPAEPKKEVLPDKASVDEVTASAAAKPKAPVMSEMERMAAMTPQVDVTEIGARKRFKR